ncbi:hypothetical protein DICPUDRAFT_156965 [Dictyostelium purpureum]|uniref:Uncharacterized protein n=1 Tax=Dictyostelium purpureum TaxID=5786 RepID=F0ZXX0_DICPU|nr:uncharacterized protein DICPUDRAFT_156965 [Dictyostelium purpureum]EGC31209.1 hypothetical protein DICPUDRAFT_156965 [Dictyostelium purpureum]|eukprot:XP_003292269.1 hypothetical protein DICPUDRAFT_156965 [Dictyostelium purpureum]
MDIFLKDIESNNLKSFDDTQKNEILEIIKKTIDKLQNNNNKILIINNNNNSCSNSRNDDCYNITLGKNKNNNKNNHNLNINTLMKCKFDYVKNKNFLFDSFKNFLDIRNLFLIKYPGLYSLIRWTTEIKKIPNESFGKDNLNDWEIFDLNRQVQYRILVFKFAILLKEQNPNYSLETIEDINVEPYENDQEIHKIQFHIIEHFNYQVKKLFENHFYKKTKQLNFNPNDNLKQQFKKILTIFPNNSFMYSSLKQIYENRNQDPEQIDLRYLTFRLHYDYFRFKISKEYKQGQYSIDNYIYIILPFYNKIDISIDNDINNSIESNTNNNNKHYIDLKNNQPKKKTKYPDTSPIQSPNLSISYSSPSSSPNTSTMSSPIAIGYSSPQTSSPIVSTNSYSKESLSSSQDSFSAPSLNDFKYISSHMSSPSSSTNSSPKMIIITPFLPGWIPS